MASAENPADDPTRHVPIRQPVSPLPSWYPGEDPDVTEEEEKLKFDAWLRDKGADPIQLSGLPDLLELHPLLDGESQWTKKSRLVLASTKWQKQSHTQTYTLSFVKHRGRRNFVVRTWMLPRIHWLTTVYGRKMCLSQYSLFLRPLCLAVVC